MSHRDLKNDLLAGSGITQLYPTLSAAALRLKAEAKANDGGLANDILRGAAAIAEFLFGDSKYARRVFHLAATSRLPVFKLGSMLHARKSVLVRFIEDQERRGARDDEGEES